MTISLTTHRYRALAGGWSGWFSDPRPAEDTARWHARYDGERQRRTWLRWSVVDWATGRVMAEG